MPRLQSGESRQKAKCREAGAESWELGVGSGKWEVGSGKWEVGCEVNAVIASRFALLSRAGMEFRIFFARRDGLPTVRQKSTNGKTPRAGIGESQRMAKCHEPNLGILRVIFDEMPYSPQNPEMLYMISLKRLYLS